MMTKPIEAKIEITNIENVKTGYSNHVQISHTPHEFIITFCFIDSAKISKGEITNIPAEAFSRIIISPSLLPKIMKAFEINLKEYNEGIKKEMESEKWVSQLVLPLTF